MRHSIFYSVCFFFLITSPISFSNASETTLEAASESEQKSIETKKKPPMDWSRPVVSRGFGEVVAKTADDKLKVEQYQSGQVLYFFGDYKKAIEKWEPLLKDNFAVAQASMGWLYQIGLGVEKDTKKAFQLYLAAAKQENAVAQNNLGVMYEQGIEVDIDFKQARLWYEKSAKNGYRFAQYNYANVLLDGIGGKKDIEQAVEWYNKASEQKVKQATEKLQTINALKLKN